MRYAGLVASAGGLVAVVSVAGHGRAAPVEQAPPRLPEAAPPVDDGTQSCASCHSAIAREWQLSAHRRSGTDPAYVSAVTKEPLPFCRACHIPSGDPSKPTPQDVAERGIGCIDCHVGYAPDHARSRAKPRFASSRTCASCHEFRFPSSPGLMQRTVTEHAVSAFAGTPCEGCHMPRAGGERRHADHRFEVDTAMLHRALGVSATRAGPSRIAVRIKPGEVGHAMPTGDLFRRLEVRAFAEDERGKVVADKTRYLSRKFRTEVVRGVYARVDDYDDRVGAGLAPCFELELGTRGAGRTIELVVAYQRVQEPHTSEERGAVVNATTSLFHVRVAASEPAQPCPVPSTTRTK